MKKKTKAAKLKKPEMFMPSSISDYSVTGMTINGVLAFVLEPQKEWLPYFSFEMHFSGKEPSEINLFLLDRNPFEPKKENLFNTKDRLRMVAKKRPGIASLCENALPFINLKIDFEDRAVLKLVRDSDGEIKIASNGFEESVGLHPSSLQYSKIAECIAGYVESTEGKKLKAEALGSFIRQTASMVSFHSSVKGMGLREDHIELRIQKDAITPL